MSKIIPFPQDRVRRNFVQDDLTNVYWCLKSFVSMDRGLISGQEEVLATQSRDYRVIPVFSYAELCGALIKAINGRNYLPHAVVVEDRFRLVKQYPEDHLPVQAKLANVTRWNQYIAKKPKEYLQDLLLSMQAQAEELDSLVTKAYEDARLIFVCRNLSETHVSVRKHHIYRYNRIVSQLPEQYPSIVLVKRMNFSPQFHALFVDASLQGIDKILDSKNQLYS